MMTESSGQKFDFKYLGEKDVNRRNESARLHLDDQDGNQVSISDFQGQKVLIWFYPRASTPG